MQESNSTVSNQQIEKAISIFFSYDKHTDSEFIDSCQLLVDSGIWLSDEIIGDTCLFLIQTGALLLPESDQYLEDGTMIIGIPRKNLIN